MSDKVDPPSVGNRFDKKYFEEYLEWPTDIALRILPWGQLWDGQPNDLLDAFINHVEIKKAYVLSRYHHWEDEIDILPRGMMSYCGVATKREIFDFLVGPNNPAIHTPLDTAFRDDVLILAHIPPHASTWMVFWYHRSGRHLVGRFSRPVDEAVLFEDFRQYAEFASEERPGSPPAEIPLKYFKGWIGS